jgi:hypothetical protein
MEKSLPSTSDLPNEPAWPSTSLSRTALGSAAPMKTPTASSGSSFPKAQISQDYVTTTFNKSKTC